MSSTGMFLIFYTEHLESRNPSVTEQNRKIEPRRHKTEELGQKSLQYHQIAEETQRLIALGSWKKKHKQYVAVLSERDGPAVIRDLESNR